MNNWNDELSSIYDDYKIKISSLEEPLHLVIPDGQIDSLVDMNLTAIKFKNLIIKEWNLLAFDDHLNEDGYYIINIITKYGNLDVDKKDINNFFMIEDNIYEINELRSQFDLYYNPNTEDWFYTSNNEDLIKCYVHLTPPVKNYFKLIFDKLKTSVSTIYADKNGNIL